MFTGKRAFAFTFIVFCFQKLLASSEYQFLCDTVKFGERLPLRLIEINPNSIKTCGKLCSSKQVIRYVDQKKITTIPDDWIKKKTEYNSHLLAEANKLQPKHKSTYFQPIKRAVFVDQLSNVHILETRYVNYPHLLFKMILKCDSEKNCHGEFINTDLNKGKLIRKIDKDTLEDSRPESQSIRAEFVFGPREKSRLIVRLFKENITNNMGQNIPTSSSGEINISPNDKKIELDVGADEQFKVYSSEKGPAFERLATAELKLICHKIK